MFKLTLAMGKWERQAARHLLLMQIASPGADHCASCSKAPDVFPVAG
ncbi:MAG: hypothetical protein ACU0B9_12325 [Limimaricola soesokkakensis]